VYQYHSLPFLFRLQVLNILQKHYVETLGRALIVNLPRLLSFFYKGISPFLDPVTRDKVGGGFIVKILLKHSFTCNALIFHDSRCDSTRTYSI